MGQHDPAEENGEASTLHQSGSMPPGLPRTLSPDSQRYRDLILHHELPLAIGSFSQSPHEGKPSATAKALIL